MKKNNLSTNLLHLQDGEEALNFIFAEDFKINLPKLILLDIRMPNVDGLEVLRKVKSDAAKKSIPVVLLTSSQGERDIVESYRLGVNAYVVKPVEFETFVKAVSEIGLFWLVLDQSSHL